MIYDVPRVPLERIGVYNFKAFGNYTEIGIGKLTILSGLNSAGKSSIYQILLLLVQSQDSYITDVFGNRIPYLKLNGDMVKFGASEDILHNKEIKKIGVTLTWSNGVTNILEYELQKIDSSIIFENKINYLFILSAYSLKPEENVELRIARNDETWSIFARNTLCFTNYEMTRVITHALKEELESIGRLGEISAEGTFWPFESVVELNGLRVLDFKGIVLNEALVPLLLIENLLLEEYRGLLKYEVLKARMKDIAENEGFFFLGNSYLGQYQKYLLTGTTISYIPPFRGYPQRVYTDTTEPNPIGLYARDKRRVISYSYDLELQHSVYGTVEEALQFWVVDHFGLAEGIVVEEPIEGLVSEIFLMIRGNKLPINNVGFGTSQILPVIFKCLINNTTDIFVIDEPEIHLHASLQSKLATFFYHMMLIGKTIILETHSEYLIDKTIYHVLLNDSIKDSVRMYWITSADSTETEIKDIKFDDLGYVINPPEGFLFEKAALVSELNELRLSKL